MNSPRTDGAHGTDDHCARIAAAGWGVCALPTAMGSLQDQVFRLDVDGTPAATMKMSTPDRVDELVLTAEAELLRHLSRARPALRLPLLMPGLNGTLFHRSGGVTARMMSWVDGLPLAAAPYFTSDSLRALGRIVGEMSTALETFAHPGLREHVDWDPRVVLETVSDALTEVVGTHRPTIVRALDVLGDLIPRATASDLPRQAVHLDLTDHNVIGGFDPSGGFRPTGVIDFGDVVHTWRVCEVAVAAHAAIGRNPHDPLAALTPVLEGYLEHQTMSEAECDHLWSVILARATTCAAVEHVDAQKYPDNEYLTALAELDAAALDGILAVDRSLARGTIRSLCGLTAHPVDLLAHLLAERPTPLLAPEAVTPGSAWQSLADTDDSVADSAAPKALRLGTRVVVPCQTPILAPLDAEAVDSAETSLTLAFSLDDVTVYLRIEGLVPAVTIGGRVPRGHALGVAGGADHPGLSTELDLQLGTHSSMPARGKVRDRGVWAELCPDPGPLFGRQATSPELRMTLAQRHRHVASAQGAYYRTPPEFTRARGQWMYDDTGRRYLDMVNNVAAIGHSHPRVTAAATDQMGQLNTNSRFLYRAIAEYADRIAETLPSQLQSIFLVNSGSEAVELALQMARRYTGRRDAVALENSYHGWTTEVFELCTLPGDRPNWRSELAPWVHIADSPDWYRGPHGTDVSRYLASLTDACTAAENNGGVAAFVHEPILGSLGGVIPPEGYLHDAYEIVRRAGGLCVADEVQVGYGRTGDTFWAFESQDVVPDILMAAKAAGNGHPVGFVACNAEIAEAMATGSTYFSTPAGSPVSCRIGTVVLDVLRDEGLQHNAADVGGYLAEQLSVLADRHRHIGAVYGRGLYQGIDLVEGDGSTTPLNSTAVDAICERLLELGCVVQPTGLHGNVLKVKPPLCIRRSDAELFVSRIDQVLTEREAFATLARPHTPSTDWRDA